MSGACNVDTQNCCVDIDLYRVRNKAQKLSVSITLVTLTHKTVLWTFDLYRVRNKAQKLSVSITLLFDAVLVFKHEADACGFHYLLQR